MANIRLSKRVFDNPIAYWRVSNKLSHKALADILGVSPQTICNWENGKTKPPKKMRRKIASIMMISVEDLEKELGIEVDYE